jgi:hypothetical protein
MYCLAKCGRAYTKNEGENQPTVSNEVQESRGKNYNALSI